MKKKAKTTKKQMLKYYVKKHKEDAIKTLGLKEFLRRYEPEKYRKMLDKGM